MIRRFRFAAASAAFLAMQPLAVAELSAAEPSADTSAAPSDQKGPAAKDAKVEEKKICSYEWQTGSIRRVRICRTQAEIDADHERSQTELDNQSRMRRTG